ncbi:hypothetical protein I79_002152 [Cricetulus griseus]|uniref:Uncharacterized protein n=1 Tax=Cricetulus griseus TaxID=10029 RepID=G3GWM5_CRIGR|nr:hypothetical protein I79_002152 [Cricetulus griseus]
MVSGVYKAGEHGYREKWTQALTQHPYQSCSCALYPPHPLPRLYFRSIMETTCYSNSELNFLAQKH